MGVTVGVGELKPGVTILKFAEGDFNFTEFTYDISFKKASDSN